MFCPKCRGIQEVIKIHEQHNSNKSRLCDVQCLKCGYIVYYQPYDYGFTLNSISNNKTSPK